MNTAWIESRIALALRLDKGECGGSYAESTLILSSLLSGIASDLWPGSKDRVRFVELWAHYAAASLSPLLISTPVLLEHLESVQNWQLADRLRGAFPRVFSPRGLPDTLVVVGVWTDKSETEITQLLPELSIEQIRSFSYPNLFYKHFRSGYVHEYSVGSAADANIMSATRAAVTYSNWMERPHRRINFAIEWVASVARSIAANVSEDWERRPLPQPVAWWGRAA